MKHARHVLSLVIVTMLSVGCSVTPETPAQAVFAAHQGYDAALSAAVAYRKLPPCATPAVQPCRDKEVLEQLRKADNVAKTAMDAAQSAVRTPGFGQDVAKSAIAASNAALQALVSILSQFYPQALKGAK